jgi:uncharacterized protein YabE (DUF348 family)
LPRREGVPISEHLSRRAARHAHGHNHGHNHDVRARHYALRTVRPSPARAEAPEPDVWLPILDITGEIAALDLTAELELLSLEEGRVDLDRELSQLEDGFWSTAAFRLEQAVARVAPVEADPAAAEAPGSPDAPTPDPISLFRAPDGTPGAAAPTAPADAASDAPEQALVPARLPEPEVGPALAVRTSPRRSEIVAHRKQVRLRRRLLSAGLVVALLAACAAVAPNIFGRSEPQRDVTLSVDGQIATITTRAATVADVLAAQQVSLRAGDRVIPALAAPVREDMPIRVLRSFPVTVEIDGALHAARTTRRNPAMLRRELKLAPGLVLAAAPKRLQPGSTISLRTPKDVSLTVDGKTTPVSRTPALDVAGLLAASGVTLGANDEVRPALPTRLTEGLVVTVYRLAQDQVSEQVAVPYATERRTDPNLPRGQEKELQAGRNGLQRVVYQVKMRDGVAIDKVRVASEMLTPPTPRIVAVGSKVAAAAPVAAAATGGGTMIQSGSATWYGTGPGPGTCAHLSLPFGTRVRIVNVATGASAVCRVADRGPEAWTGHIIDLSPDVFGALAPRSAGVIRVQLYRL